MHIYTHRNSLCKQLPVTPFVLVATASALPEEGTLRMLPHLLQKKNVGGVILLLRMSVNQQSQAD